MASCDRRFADEKMVSDDAHAVLRGDHEGKTVALDGRGRGAWKGYSHKPNDHKAAAGYVDNYGRLL